MESIHMSVVIFAAGTRPGLLGATRHTTVLADAGGGSPRLTTLAMKLPHGMSARPSL